jgi:hypothetical protein
LVLVTLCYLSGVAHSQTNRWDIGNPGSAGVVTFSGSGLAFLVAQGNVTLAWCNYPANTAPCTNYATTYTSSALSTPCPTNAQVVLQGSNTCQATSDNFGNLGVYTAPGTYSYTLTVNGVTYGPYIGQAGFGGPGSPTGSLQANNNGAFAGVPNSSVNFTSGNIISTAGLSFGTLNATTISSAAQFLSNSSNPASSGTIALANSDSILWRNFANNANEGLSVDSSDIGHASFAGGFGLTGATAKLWFGGFTSSFPMLKPVSATLQARLGDDSNYAGWAAANLLGPVASPPGTPASSTQIGYYVAGKGWCAKDSSANVYCTVAGSGSAVLQQFTVTLGSPIAVSGSTPTTILSQAVTMPSVGCPCRAFVSWGIDFESSNTGVTAAWVNDGTNSFASAWYGNASSYNSGTGFNASAYSTGTAYANSAAITFTLTLEQTTGSSFNVQSTPQFGSGQATWLNVVITSSN